MHGGAAPLGDYSYKLTETGRERAQSCERACAYVGAAPVPLEHRCDYLTLCTGKKIEVPFEQLIIFSTNLDPDQLVDEAFLRRIPYKIHVEDPSEEEFLRLFDSYAKNQGCEFRVEAVRQLLDVHYRPCKRPLRRCHARDLLLQVRNYCAYYDLPVEMKFEYLDHAARTYFGLSLSSLQKS